MEQMTRIMTLYPDIDPAKLPVGKIICIPDEANACGDGLVKYKIKRGDTFFSISKQNSDLMEQIMSLSPDVDPASLPVGKSICVPSSLVSNKDGESKKKLTKKHKIIKVIETVDDDSDNKDETTMTNE